MKITSKATFINVLHLNLLFAMIRKGNERKIIVIVIALAFVITGTSGENQNITQENITCENIESSEFPQDLFTEAQRKYGAVILHMIFAAYCFVTIAFICSERFLPTITCICEDLKLSPDVAAATFMSLATSVPELFSSIIGTFIANSSIGIGHIIGNGYFNTFFVAAIGGMAAKQEIILEWWPLTRDCITYALVALTLSAIIWDGIVKTYETLILLSLYIIYFIIMFNNKKILVFLCKRLNIEVRTNQNEMVENREIEEKTMKERKYFKETEPLDSENEFALPPPLSPSVLKDKNNLLSVNKKIFSMPINFLIRYTIPNVKKVKWRKYYPAAFLICVAWIGVSTYLGVWMVSLIGDTLGVSDLIMGMVVMAAGGSVVEAYCVYWKAKRGECNIGLSNCLGCNNMDATLCLALPWFIKTLPIQISACNTYSSNVILESSLIYINCLLLVLSVISLLAIFYLNKFKLDKKLGVVCGSLYAIILFIGISVESYDKKA